jgi:phenylpropionate dioxygenase-like ring-hydroxylating dioxygenase large terminal subunit
VTPEPPGDRADELRLLRHLWFPVARSQDVADGRVGSGQIMETELVLYRVDGQVTAAQAHCPHRWAALVDGKVVSGALECPYHGWRFAAASGRCVHVPSLPDLTPPGRAALRTYRVREAFGLIWAVLDKPYLDLPETDELSAARWQVMYAEPKRLRCGIRQLTENFRDVSHLPFVHERSLGPGTRREVDRYAVTRTGWELSWSVGGTPGQPEARYRCHPPSLSYVQVPMSGGVWRIVGQVVTPIGDEGLECRQFPFVGISAGTRDGPILRDLFEWEMQIFSEDWPIVERQATPEPPLDLHSQVHTRADRFSIAFRRTYRELLTSFVADEIE